MCSGCQVASRTTTSLCIFSLTNRHSSWTLSLVPTQLVGWCTLLSWLYFIEMVLYLYVISMGSTLALEAFLLIARCTDARLRNTSVRRSQKQAPVDQVLHVSEAKLRILYIDRPVVEGLRGSPSGSMTRVRTPPDTLGQGTSGYRSMRPIM